MILLPIQIIDPDLSRGLDPSYHVYPLFKSRRAPLARVESIRVPSETDFSSEMSKLFVYGVNRNCPRHILEEAFMKFGKVEEVSTIVINHMNVASLGCIHTLGAHHRQGLRLRHHG